MVADVERLALARDALLLTLGRPPADEFEASAKSSDMPRVPVTILSGFLGAGKTTLLCELLEQRTMKPAMEIVAIVNDMASINVDAALVRSKNAETIEFENGCACCVLGSDLRNTLRSIGTRREPPDAIVIEASGLSDPMGIARTVADVESVALDGIVTVVDALSFRERAADRVTAHLFERQLAAAHLIALTKTHTQHCQNPLPLTKLRDEVGRLAPGRPVLISDAGETKADVLLGAATRGAGLGVREETPTHEGFAVQTVEWSGAASAPEFFSLLDDIPDAIYRVKGWVWLQEVGSPRVQRSEVQVAGRRWRVTGRDASDDRSQLVVIGRAADQGFEDFVDALRALAEDSYDALG